jgi:hypothetical protein
LAIRSLHRQSSPSSSSSKMELSRWTKLERLDQLTQFLVCGSTLKILSVYFLLVGRVDSVVNWRVHSTDYWKYTKECINPAKLGVLFWRSISSAREQQTKMSPTNCLSQFVPHERR